MRVFDTYDDFDEWLGSWLPFHGGVWPTLGEAGRRFTSTSYDVLTRWFRQARAAGGSESDL